MVFRKPQGPATTRTRKKQHWLALKQVESKNSSNKNSNSNNISNNNNNNIIINNNKQKQQHHHQQQQTKTTTTYHHSNKNSNYNCNHNDPHPSRQLNTWRMIDCLLLLCSCSQYHSCFFAWCDPRKGRNRFRDFRLLNHTWRASYLFFMKVVQKSENATHYGCPFNQPGSKSTMMIHDHSTSLEDPHEKKTQPFGLCHGLPQPTFNHMDSPLDDDKGTCKDEICKVLQTKQWPKTCKTWWRFFWFYVINIIYDS